MTIEEEEEACTTNGNQYGNVGNKVKFKFFAINSSTQLLTLQEYGLRMFLQAKVETAVKFRNQFETN